MEEFPCETIDRISDLQREILGSIKAFNTMGAEAKRPSALDEKTKELIALGIAVSTRCESCIGFHVRSLVRLGTSRSELCEAVAMIAYMGGGPSVAFGAKALEAFDEFSEGGA